MRAVREAQTPAPTSQFSFVAPSRVEQAATEVPHRARHVRRCRRPASHPGLAALSDPAKPASGRADVRRRTPNTPSPSLHEGGTQAGNNVVYRCCIQVNALVRAGRVLQSLQTTCDCRRKLAHHVRACPGAFLPREDSLTPRGALCHSPIPNQMLLNPSMLQFVFANFPIQSRVVRRWSSHSRPYNSILLIEMRRD